MSETITIIKQKSYGNISIERVADYIEINNEYFNPIIPIERSNIPALREALLKFYEGKEEQK